MTKPSLLPRRSSIRTRLTVLILIASSAVVTTGFLMEMSWDIRDFRSQALHGAGGAARMLSADFVKVLLLDSPHAAIELIPRLKSFNDLNSATLFDANNRIVFTYERDRDQPSELLPRPETDHRFENSQLHTWHPLRLNGVEHGTLYLRSSMERLEKDVITHLGNMAFIFPLVLIAAVAVAFASQGFFTKPLLALHDAAQRVSETQDYTIRVKTNDKTEIGLLCIRFNQMLEKIEQSSRAVHEAKQQLRETNLQLQNLATHDSLTGLINRREFERHLSAALNETKKKGPASVLLYLDLDQFKIVNDSCGHIAGDHLLCHVSDVLKGKLEDQHSLARLGGDEFGVLLRDCDEQQAVASATLISEAVRNIQFLWDGKLFTLGVSIGLVAVMPHHHTLTELFSCADTACYAAKESGRNRVHVFREHDEHILQRQNQMQWVARIRLAIEEERLLLYYQPIVTVGETLPIVRHYEILLRMRDETGKIVTPTSFVPAAERYGLMNDLDRWVVSHALDWLSNALQIGIPIDVFSINISGTSLVDDEFLEFVNEKIAQSGVPTRCVCFEVTETAAITNFAKATRFMQALKSRGCRFALDDFGSGASSFGYLKHLPVDMIKIDGVFVKDILHDPIDAAMVRSIVEIGRAIGLQTIAEFVVTPEILTRLRQLGVDYAQGYAIAEPAPLDDLLTLSQQLSQIKRA